MFKTTKLLLRRIDPGTVVIGGVKPVSFSKPYYIGVYEVTQKQYELIADVNCLLILPKSNCLEIGNYRNRIALKLVIDI